LTPTMHEISRHPEMEMVLVVTDQHLYRKFGHTVQEVEDNFPVAAWIDMEQDGDSDVDRARAIGRCLTKISDVFADLKPDIILIIGDRGEVFAACIAAHNMRIAIAHVQGGDISGSLDEPVRHAITKLSHIHFPSIESSAQRILNMGEEPWRVHIVGDTHIDQIFFNKIPEAEALWTRYGLPIDDGFILVLQHSDSTNPRHSTAQMVETIAALSSINMRTLFVYPCSDQGYEGIINEIERAADPPRFTVHRNIPAPEFIGLQRLATCMVGNSSAGLIEAPYFGLPAVNIGDRQVGRQRAGNVLDVPHDRVAIEAAIRKALTNVEFRKELKHLQPPFGDGQAYKKITRVLASVEINDQLLNKRMTY